MMTKDKSNQPLCRFPEFRNTGEWKEEMMQTIFDIKNGYTPSKSNPLYWEDGTIPWFRMEDIRKNGHILSDSIQHITALGVKKGGLFPAYSIIVATTATIGEHALIIVDSLANQRFTFLTKRKSLGDSIDMLYFHYFMFIVDEWCKRNTNSGGLLSVNMDSFKKLVIPYPQSLTEQHKIAGCFSTLDRMIDATKRKLELLKEHRKGLIQRLFPAKGKTVPDFRFPEFRNDADWKYERLGDIGDTYGGLSGKNAGDFGSGKPYITYKQVYNGSEIDCSECASVRIDAAETQNRVKCGDVLITMSSETPDEVGYTAVVTNNDLGECYLNSFCFIYRVFAEIDIDIKFLKYLFSSELYRTSVIRIAQGSTRFNISKARFKDIVLAIPDNKKEQKQIADTLLSSDRLIHYYSDKVIQMEQHRQGLMQQLFPKI